MRQSIRHFFNRLFRYTVLINLRTNEAHDITVVEKNCKQHLIASHNRKYIKPKQFKKERELNPKLNGCRWCMEKYDTDKFKH